MPRSCVIGGCSNSNYDGVTVHFWPKNEKLARMWDSFAQIKRADWTKGIPGVSTICGIHFTPSDYDSYGQWKAGLTARLRLKKDAVPTVNVGFSGAHWSPTTQQLRKTNRPFVFKGMPKRCAIGGCSNSNYDGVTLHCWPKNETLGSKWDLFARIKRADWGNGIPGVSIICGSHFLPTDYDNYGQWKAGMISRLRLNNDAVPTVNVSSGATDTGVQQQRRCVIGGCSNSNYIGVTLHFWPNNEKLARKWDLFVRIKRADWVHGIPGESNICGIHFLPTDYHQWKAGLSPRLRLKNDAVPTVHVNSGAPDSGVQQQAQAPAVIEVNQCLADTITGEDSSSSSDSDDSSSSSVSDSDVEDSVGDKAQDKSGVLARLVRNDEAVPSRNRKLLRSAAEESKAHADFLSQFKLSRDIGCQTDFRLIGCQTDLRLKKSVGTQYKIVRADPQLKRSFGTQVSWTRRLTRSQGTQISVLSVSVGIGTPFQWKRPPPIQNSTFRKPFQPSKRRRLTLDDGESVLTESTLSQASPSINDVPEYVVDEDCLLQLFEECPVCSSMCEVQKTTRETVLTVYQLCPQCNFNRDWRSRQTEKAVPSGDVRSCTSDPESSAAITAIIGSSDGNDSSDEGQSSEVDPGDRNSDSDWDPVEHHNGDGELAGSESDADGRYDACFRQLCPECGKYFYNHKTHTCENKKPYSCNVCGKRFLCEYNLKAHSKTHEDGYKHVCKYCCSTFRTRPDKLAHEQRHPPRKKPYQCPDCPQVFAKIEERRVHLLSHRGPKRHICHICSMAFFNPNALDRHMVVHTNAKQFVCEVCQRSFTQSSHLKSHMRVHTGEKPYQCQHCDKSFNHNVSLKSHIQRYHGQVPDPGEKIQIEKTSTNVSEVEKDERNEMESSGVDAEGAKTDEMESSGVDADEAEQSDTLYKPDDEELQKVKKRRKRFKYTSTGRPRGRPKKNTLITLDDTNQLKRPLSTGRPRGRPKKNTLITLDDANQLERPLCISDENEKGQGNSTDEEQEHNSDLDFEPVK